MSPILVMALCSLKPSTILRLARVLCLGSAWSLQVSILTMEHFLHTMDDVMRGCHLLESCMASSLSCFYSSSCINALIQAMPLESSDACSGNIWDQSWSLLPLDLSNAWLLKHFKMNDAFASIVSEHFIDLWSINTSYESFFDACMVVRSLCYARSFHR